MYRRINRNFHAEADLLSSILFSRQRRLRSCVVAQTRDILRQQQFHQQQQQQQHRTRYIDGSYSINSITNSGILNLYQSSVVVPFHRTIVSVTELTTTSNNTTSSDNDSNPTSGVEAFTRYIQLTDTIRQLHDERERIKSEQMFEAWKRADEKEKEHGGKYSLKNKGVAVVKTIVKQTRKEKLNTEYNSNNDSEDDEEFVLNQQAEHMLQTSAIQYKYPKALVLMGNRLLEQAQLPGHFDDDNVMKKRELLKQSLQYYELAGQGGSSEGYYNLGHLLWTGIPDQTLLNRDNVDKTNDININESQTSNNNDEKLLLRSDRAKAMDAFLQGCRLNDPDAMYFVGVQLMGNDDDRISEVHDIEENTILVQHKKEGLQWIERSATLGHCGALYYLALFYLNGDTDLNIQPCTDNEFVQRLNLAVDSGGTSSSSDALFLRGNCYYHGNHGYDINYKNALNDFLTAANTGNHADAAVSAGAMLFSSDIPGIIQDQRRAFELYQLAGELGSLDGWRNVVACYATGEGVPQSMEMAKYISKTMLGQQSENDTTK